jgi:hypothetical protein
MYEYKFERMAANQFTLSGFQVDESVYQNVIREYARSGWRLVQIFAPPLTSQGRPKFYEMIFERPVSKEAEASTRGTDLDGSYASRC